MTILCKVLRHCLAPNSDIELWKSVIPHFHFNFLKNKVSIYFDSIQLYSLLESQKPVQNSSTPNFAGRSSVQQTKLALTTMYKLRILFQNPVKGRRQTIIVYQRENYTTPCIIQTFNLKVQNNCNTLLLRITCCDYLLLMDSRRYLWQQKTSRPNPNLCVGLVTLDSLCSVIFYLCGQI